jgi:hypothetical protein
MMTAEAAPTGQIIKAISAIMAADLYVQKRGKNQFHGYKYATIGDLLDRIQPLMGEHGLVIFQNELDREFMDDGRVLAVRYQFTLAHSSGETWPERPVHTGMSGCRNQKGGFDDKAANKCHTAARKYFILGLFQVPTGEDYREPAHDGDADGDGPQGPAAQKPKAPPPRIVKSESAPKQDPHRIDVPVLSDGDGSDWIAWGQRYAAAINGATDAGDLEAWVRHNAVAMGGVSKANPKAHARLANLIDQRRIALAEMPAPTEGAADATILDAGD